jgi:adenylate cyclase
MRVLTVTTRIGAAVSVFFGIQQFVVAQDALWLGYLNLASAVVFLLIPQLYRYGDLPPPVVFILVAYTGMTVSSTYVGSGVGLHFYFAVAAAIVVLVLGIEHIVLASCLAVLGAVTVIALELWVPHRPVPSPTGRSGWASSSTPSRHGSSSSRRSGTRCARSLGPRAPWRPNTSAPNRYWPTSCPRPSRNA